MDTSALCDSSVQYLVLLSHSQVCCLLEGGITIRYDIRVVHMIHDLVGLPSQCVCPHKYTDARRSDQEEQELSFYLLVF